jgi:hypothetical protein
MINTTIITIHKTKFEFHFGMGFLGELLSGLDLDISEMMAEVSKNPFKMIPIIMHGAAKYGAERKGKEFDYTVYDFIDFIDADGGITAKSVEKFLEAFTNSMTKDVPKEDEPIKKKKPQLKS